MRRPVAAVAPAPVRRSSRASGWAAWAWTLVLVGLPASVGAQTTFETQWLELLDLNDRCERLRSAPSATQRALPDGVPEPITAERALVDPHDVGIDAKERSVAAQLRIPTLDDGWITFAAQLRSSCEDLVPVYPSMDVDSAAYSVSGRGDSIDVNLRQGWLYANVRKLVDGSHATFTVGGRTFPLRPHSPTEVGVGVSPADTVIVVRKGSVTVDGVVIGPGQEWRASRGAVLQEAPEEALHSIDRIGIEEWMGWPGRAWRAFRERPGWQQLLAAGVVAWGTFELVRSDSYEVPGRDVGVRVRFP